MLFYFIFFVFLAFLYLVFKGEKNKKFFCLIAGILVFLIFSLRSENLGMYDVADSYVPLFKQINSYSFSELAIKYKKSGILFYFLTKTIRSISSNEHIWLSILSIPIVVSVTLLIYRYSKYPLISFFLFFFLGFFNINVTILRQSISLAFGIFSFLAINKKKTKFKNLLFSFFLCLIAFGFHTTGILTFAIPILSLFRIKLSLFAILFTLLISGFVWTKGTWVLEIAFKIISNGNFQRYLLHLSKFNSTMILVNVAIFFFCCLSFFPNRKKMEGIDIKLIYMIAAALPFFAFTSVFSDLYRTALYFSIFGIVAIPNAFTNYKDKSVRIIVIIAVIIICGIYGYKRGLLEVTPYEWYL